MAHMVITMILHLVWACKVVWMPIAAIRVVLVTKQEEQERLMGLTTLVFLGLGLCLAARINKEKKEAV